MLVGGRKAALGRSHYQGASTGTDQTRADFGQCAPRNYDKSGYTDAGQSNHEPVQVGKE